MPKEQDNVIKYQKTLDKILAKPDPIDKNQTMDVLKRLGETKITYEILKITLIGKTIGKIRKRTEDPDINSKCKSVLSTWKIAVEKEKKASSSASKAKASASSSREPEKLARRNSLELSQTIKTGTKERDQSIRQYAVLFNTDAEALEAHKTSAVTISAKIEAALFNRFKSVGKGYVKAFRERKAILSENMGMRMMLITGAVSPEEFAKMKPEDMESAEVKEKKREAKEKLIHECTQPTKQLQTTLEHICGKCKGNRTQFFEMQTRSADEPMTVFIFCMTPGCHNNWKN